MTPTPQTESSKDSSREALIKAALKLFASKGFDSTSVKELADEAGVNVSLVSYYFGGKDGLYRECIHMFGAQRLVASERILTKADSAEAFKVRLQLFIEEMIHFWLESPEVCQIVSRECDSQFTRVEDIFQSTFMKAFEKLITFIKESQKAKIIDPTFDPMTLSLVIHGSIIHLMRSDHLGEKYFKTTIKNEAHRSKVVKNIIELVMRGIAKP